MSSVLRSIIVLALVGLAAVAHAQQPPAAGPSSSVGTGAAAAPEGGGEQGIEDLQSLLGESVVTTASRGAERASAAPASVFTITARELEVFGIRSVDDALEYLGLGIYVLRPRDYETGIDVGAQGIIERDGGRRILVLVDGHVMNSQDTGQVTIHEGLGVPLEAIDHIEVMLGAGSVVYGSNAMTAVIQVFTRNAGDHATVRATAGLQISPPVTAAGAPTVPDKPGERAGLRYRLGVGALVPFRWLGSSAQFALHAEWLEELSNSYATPIMDASTPDNGWNAYAGESTWGGTAHHTMQAPSVLASLRVGEFRLEMMGNYYFHNMPFNGRFSDPNSREERFAGRIDLTHSTFLVPEANLSTRLYADFTDWGERTSWTLQSYCFEGEVDGCHFERSSRGRSAGLEQILTVDWKLDGVFVSTLGYDIRGRDTTARPSDYSDLTTGALPVTLPLPYIHQVTALGAIFAQQIWRPADWLTLNAGARLDLDTQFGARLSPRLAAVWTPADGTSVRASYAEAFRAPTAFELYESDRTYRLPALSLKPEIVRTADVEYRQHAGFFDFSVRAFVAFYEDVIASQVLPMDSVAMIAAMRGYQLSPTADPTYILTYANISGFRSFGGTVGVTARPAEGLLIAGSFTIFDSHRYDEGVEGPVTLLPLWSGNARISYELSHDGPAFALAARFAADRLAPDDTGCTPAATPTNPTPATVYCAGPGMQLDLRATFSAPIEAVHGLRIRASLGYSVNPYLPYLFAGTVADPMHPPYMPVTTPMFGMLEATYEIAP